MGNPSNSEGYLILDEKTKKVYLRRHVTFDERWREHLHLGPGDLHLDGEDEHSHDPNHEHDESHHDHLQDYMREQEEMARMYDDDPDEAEQGDAAADNADGGMGLAGPDGSALPPAHGLQTPVAPAARAEPVAPVAPAIPVVPAVPAAPAVPTLPAAPAVPDPPVVSTSDERRTSSRSNKFSGTTAGQCHVTNKVKDLLGANPKLVHNDERLGTGNVCFMSTEDLAFEQYCYAAIGDQLADIPKTPKSYKEALRLDSAGWTQAMMDEMAALRKRGTWDTIPISQVPKGRKLIGSL